MEEAFFSLYATTFALNTHFLRLKQVEASARRTRKASHARDERECELCARERVFFFLRARLALACASSKGKQLRGEVERQVTHVQRYFLLSAMCLDSYLC